MAQNGDGILSRSEFAHLLRHGSAGCAQHEALRFYVKALDAKIARDARIAQLEAALGECVRVVKVPIYGSPIDGACRYTYDEEAHAAARALLAPRAGGDGR